MRNHLYFTSLHGEGIEEQPARIRDLRHLVREERELDVQIRELFPITAFGMPEDFLRIHGSQSLLEAFGRIDAEKIDLQEILGNIEFIGFTNDNEVILNFREDGIVASGIYDFTYDFFEELFNMGKFAKFCLNNNYNDILISNVRDLLGRQQNDARQFRILMRNDAFYLRGLTSTRYNDYDNHLALYLSLLALHKYALNNGTHFTVEKAYLSDSEIRVFTRQEEAINVPGVGNVSFGAMVTNNEIRESMFTLELRYRIYDPENPAVGFNAVPEIKSSVFNINHLTRANTVGTRLENISRLGELQRSMISYIRNLRETRVLSNDALYRLFVLITNSRLKRETKQSFRELYDRNLVRNTLTLVEAFNLTNTITTDMDEITHLERTYHQLIMELVGKGQRPSGI